jgi:glycosyltransferase involved in cell wall biosynthesis
MAMDGVSVVIPCYNGQRFLGACLDSVRAQDFRGPLEILVGDDGSADNSAAIAAAHGQPVKVLRHPAGANRGVSATRNLCLRAACHPLIAFLDADDLWLPGHLTTLTAALEANPAAGMAYDNGYYMTADGRSSGQRLAPSHRAPDAATLLLDCCLAINGVAVRKRVLEQVGLFDELLRYGEDHDLWLRIIEQFPAVYVPVYGYVYRQHTEQSTKRADLMWRDATQVLEKARVRYPYEKAVVRKRTAVISYRKGECALRRRQLMRAAYHLGKAAWCDPTRAVGELVLRLRGQGTR